jgi:hypothetical protein
VVESKFQHDLVLELRDMFPDCIILLGNSSYLQGVPDILILWRDRWAALECKDRKTSRKEPNQKYYVEIMDRMSFSAFIYPENREIVLNDLQHAFRRSRASRFPRRE